MAGVPLLCGPRLHASSTTTKNGGEAEKGRSTGGVVASINSSKKRKKRFVGGGGKGVENGKGKEKRETTTKLRSEKKYIVFSQWAYPGTNFKYEATYRSNWPPSLMPIYDNPTKRIVSPTRRYPVAMPPPE